MPGSGNFFDDAAQLVAPDTGPHWQNYAENHPIYDQWPTWGSGGFDLEAVGVLHEQQYPADINLDGIVDYRDLSLLAAAWQSQFGRENWNSRCDLAKPAESVSSTVATSRSLRPSGVMSSPGGLNSRMSEHPT